MAMLSSNSEGSALVMADGSVSVFGTFTWMEDFEEGERESVCVCGACASACVCNVMYVRE
jgi:hypothetical protein